MIQPRKWSVPLGSGADVQDLPDDDLRYASFSKIFPQITQVPLPAGGVAPRRIDFNSLFKLLADNIYFYQNGGVFEYSDTADYEKGAIVRYNDKIYLCIQDNSALNVHNPDDMNYWLRVALNNELSDYLPLVGGNLTGNLTVQNKNVVRTVNDIEADVNGNVVIDLANKADKDLSNVPSSKGILIESYHNSSSWYRKYSDGWVEQGGLTANIVYYHNSITVNLLVPFTSTDYNISATAHSETVSGDMTPVLLISSATGNNFIVSSPSNYGVYVYWTARGYLN